jgi:hypothetical protein
MPFLIVCLFPPKGGFTIMKIKDFLKQNPDIIYTFRPNNKGDWQMKIVLPFSDKRDSQITDILQQQNRPYALHPIKINYLAIFIY